MQSKELSRVFFNTTAQKHQFFSAQLSSQSHSHPYMTTRKTIALTRQNFVGKIMSLLFNMLSRLVITFLPRRKRLLISWLQSPFAVILEPPKIKSDTVSTVSPVSHHFMRNRWGNRGNSGNSVRLYFWGAAKSLQNHGDCSHEIKRCLLLGRKVMTNLDTILKSRDITLPTNVHLVKAVVFLPRSKRLLISWLQSPSAVILEPKKIKSDTVSTVSPVSPSLSHEAMGLDAMIFVF